MDNQDTDYIKVVSPKGHFTIVSNAMARDRRFGAEGISGLRAFQLLVYISSYDNGHRFVRKNVSEELGWSCQMLDRATRVAKDLGYLSEDFYV